MGALSVRLPESLDRELSEEARRLDMDRSQLVRDAVQEYIRQRVRQRFMNDMIAEMHDWLGDPAARADSSDLSEDLPEDDIDTLIASEQNIDTNQTKPWWR